LQIEFPYADSLKVQERFGNGVVFLNRAEGESFEEALRRIAAGEFAAVFTEVPSNPLLRSVDLPKLSAVCRSSGTPLVVDDSAAGPANVRALPYADVVTCSLTKWLSGSGDVMGGMTVVSEASPMAGELLAGLEREARETAPLYLKDTQVMLANLKGFAARQLGPNENGLRLARMLCHHPAVDEVWHPSVSCAENYEKIRAPGGGYGGLLSFTLKSSRRASRVFDRLKVSKGPSFGTRFTLACPYVLLAHYQELEWAEACGVPRDLIRVSCGEESGDDLEAAFAEALRFG
jgi:cystathionine gamma-synthase